MQAAPTRPSQEPSHPLFPNFSKLPLELRLFIWHAASTPDPRVVYLALEKVPFYASRRVWSDRAVGETHHDGIEVFFDIDDYTGDPYDDRWNPWYNPKFELTRRGGKFISPSAAPAILAVCRESYSVAINYYSGAFGTEHSMPNTWFDYDRDVLCVNYSMLSRRQMELRDFSIIDVRKVKHLAVDNNLAVGQYVNIPHPYDNYELWLSELLQLFCNVNELIVVVNQVFAGDSPPDLVLRQPKYTISQLVTAPANVAHIGYLLGVLNRFEKHGVSIDMKRLDFYWQLKEGKKKSKRVRSRIEYGVALTHEESSSLQLLERAYEAAASSGLL